MCFDQVILYSGYRYSMSVFPKLLGAVEPCILYIQALDTLYRGFGVLHGYAIPGFWSHALGYAVPGFWSPALGYAIPGFFSPALGYCLGSNNNLIFNET